MADLSIELASRIPSDEVRSNVLRGIDVEGRIPAAIQALGPVAGRSVVVLEAGGFRARQLSDLGAAVTALVPPERTIQSARATAGEDVTIVHGTPESTGLAEASADVAVSFWSAFEGPNEGHLVEAERILRPNGRLLIVHDYGRDDLCDFWRPAFERQIEWSQRGGPFLSIGFRIRVIHCWWTFESLEEARTILGAVFGAPGLELAGRMKRPRLEYNIAVYHRTRQAVASRAALLGSMER